MPFKLNASTISGIVDEKLGHKPDLRNDFHNLVTVYRTIGKSSVTIKDAKAFKHEILGSITAALSAGHRLLDANAVAGLQVASINALERFAILHFVSVQQAFLKGLEGTVGSIGIDLTEPTDTDLEERVTAKIERLRRMREEVQHALDHTAGLDVPYTLTVNPAAQLGGYFEEHVRILNELITALGARSSPDLLNKCIEIAMSEYNAWAVGETKAAMAVSSYLNYGQQLAHRNIVADDVRGLSVALENWLRANSSLSERRKENWEAYRKNLADLPDDKSTMFDENFGVRKVFVQPVATYKVAGVKREADAQVSDVAGLLGTLISDRIEGDDLILLCGGPGSGKSTLCRILASELARNDCVHPVFLRLRRLQDSHDIVGFLEAQLQRLGLIDKIADLASVPNLVLILDGFDELVMASRTKLREFFNALRDDLSTGPLRNAKAIVSGRDTLFPKGAGLPMGAHVISLLPFDRPRIAAWGAKWREQHVQDHAKSFYPENLVADDKHRARDTSPLEHLLSWPLTLHLVARAHTSGSINLKPEKAAQVEKAVLYRQIVADTTVRQQHQTDGRLTSQQMRKFVQAIAWEMYSSGREALDVSEGLPILRSILPNATETDLHELADVTIVNQPELTKGEETGFEFVHKSFSEYFSAEKIAMSVEEACFKGAQWGVEEETWRMSVGEATGHLAQLFAIRLLTVEVQEMLEPMLADFKVFLENGQLTISGEDVPKLLANLERKLERIEGLISDFAAGGLSAPVNNAAKASGRVINEFEGFGNYVSALLFLAVSLAGRITLLDKAAKRPVQLGPATLIRVMYIVQSGSIHVDYGYAQRGLNHLDVSGANNSMTEVFFPPVPPMLLDRVQGFILPLENAISAVSAEIVATQLENVLLRLLSDSLMSPDKRLRHRRFEYEYSYHLGHGSIDYLRKISGTSEHFPSFRDMNHMMHRKIIEEFEGKPVRISLEVIEEAMGRYRKYVHDGRYRGRGYGDLGDLAERILFDVLGKS